MNYIVKNEKELFEAVKAVNSETEAAVITVEAGTYEINESIVFTRDNVTVKANGDVNFKGSRKIPVSGSGTVEIDLKSEGITDFGKFGEGPFEDFWNECDIPKPHMLNEGPGAELFYEDKAMPLSRYPETGELRITKALGETPLIEHKRTDRIGSMEGIFLCDDDSVKEWANEDDPLLIGYWGNDWATQRHTVKSVDPKTGAIEVNPPYHTFGYRDGSMFNNSDGGAPFFALNLRCALKKPGNWCIDRKNGKIFMIPYENQKEVSISVCEDIFLLCGRENIHIIGINMSECRKSGIMMDGCKACSVEDCRIYNTGAWAVIADNCTDTKVLRCTVYDTAGGGIALSGGDRPTLTPANNIAEGCEIHDIARWHKTYLAAIELNGVGCTASENKLYDLPHFAIVFQGNNHIIEKNDIKNACYSSNDAGAIYAGRDWTCRGNIIRYNYIHDFPGRANVGCIGIYFDDAMSSAEVYGNTIVGSIQAGIELGGGRDFKIHHNTFINCHVSMMMDARLKNWGTTEKLMRHLGEVPYRNKVWENAYPELFRLLDEDFCAPKNNEFCDNLTIGGHGVAVSRDGADEYIIMKNNKFIKSDFPTAVHERYRSDWWAFPEEEQILK